MSAWLTDTVWHYVEEITEVTHIVHRLRPTITSGQHTHMLVVEGDLKTAEYAVEPIYFKVSDLYLDLSTKTVRRAGTDIALQPREFTLLAVLMRNEGRVVSRTMLLEEVWDYHFDPKTSVVETHISRLRGKVDKPFDIPLIHTVRNLGYSLHAPS